VCARQGVPPSWRCTRSGLSPPRTLENGHWRRGLLVDRRQRLQRAVQQFEDHGVVVHQQDFDVIRHGSLGLLANAGVGTALASGLVFEHDFPDFNSLVQRFTHIVHGQRGDAGRDQGFHLDPRYRRGGNS